MKQKLIHQQLNHHRFPGSIQIEETPTISCLEAQTNLETQRMTLRYNPAFNPQNPAVQRLAKVKRVGSSLDECLKDAAGHECGHVHLQNGRNCPGSVEEHEEYFYEPIHAVLKTKGKEGATDDISNLAEDLIDNTLLSQLQSSAGLTFFYDDAADRKSGKWQKAFEAYMRVQAYCWADAKERDVLSSHYTADKKVIAAARNIIRRLQLKRGDSVDILAPKEKWKEIATVMAEELADLVDSSVQLPRCGFGKRMKDAMNDPTNRQKSAVKRYTGKRKQPEYMAQEEALDHVYSYEARQIPIKVDSISRQESFPAVPYQYATFDPEEHALEEINFRKPAIVAKSPFGGHVSFQVAEQHYELPLKVKMGMKSFPKVKYGLVDCSPSMKDGIPNSSDAGDTTFIPWGNKSKYHYACKGYWGMIEYLARAGILPNVKVGGGVFSDDTYLGSGLEEVKRLLLNPPFGRGTKLDIEKVLRMFAGEKSVFFTISDGEIQNWPAIEKTFIEQARQHHYFHLQIGPDSVATKSLRKAGLPVYNVREGNELERMAADLTRQAYSGYIESVAAQLRGSS